MGSAGEDGLVQVGTQLKVGPEAGRNYCHLRHEHALSTVAARVMRDGRAERNTRNFSISACCMPLLAPAATKRRILPATWLLRPNGPIETRPHPHRLAPIMRGRVGPRIPVVTPRAP